MAGRIPDNILEDILNRVDIVELVSGYLPLKRAGRNFKACCPFHHEKTPSFMVSPERQIYHCFGCGESGNAFKFLMRYERLEFPEAVEMLAKKAGVALPEIQKQDSRTTGISTQLYKINEAAVLFYQNNLNLAQGLFARNYLLKRGIKEETIKTFKLGFACDSWEALSNYLRQKNASLSLLEKAGLILAKNDGGYYDRFRKRIIFPIFDIKSRPIGFGARILAQEKGDLAKYVNSPETPVYTKGKNLYGLNFTKDAIRENDCAIIVEGYLDFIIPYQEGLRNIVASLGTALTLEQARLLKRYTRNVVMIYDPDDAGEGATLRTLDIFIEEDMEVKVVVLPQGFDPDLFVRKEGIAGLKEKIAQAPGLYDYKLKVLKSRYDSREIEGKAKISQELLATINKFKNAVLKSEYIKRLGQDLDIEEDALLQEIRKIKTEKAYPDADFTVNRKTLNINPTEKLLVKLMLEETELIQRIKESLEPADFQDERTARVVSILFELVEQGREIGPHKLLNYFEGEDISEMVCESMFIPEMPSQNKEEIIDDCIQRLKNNRLTATKQRLQEEIKLAENSGNEDRLNSLKQEFHQLIKKR